MNSIIPKTISWKLPQFILNSEGRLANQSYFSTKPNVYSDHFCCGYQLSDNVKCGKSQDPIINPLRTICASCELLDKQFLKKANCSSGEISLKESSYNVQISTVANVQLYQKYYNTQSHPVEIKYTWTLPFQSSITKYLVKIDNEVYESKMKEKEEAKNNYSDEIAKGNTPILAEITGEFDDKEFSLSLGNVLPGKEIEINVFFIQPLDFSLSKQLSIADLSLSENTSIEKIYSLRLPGYEGMQMYIDDSLNQKINFVESLHKVLISDKKSPIIVTHNGKEPEFIVHLHCPWDKNSEFEITPFLSVENEKYCMVNYMPLLHQEFSDEPSEIVFFIDTSGSMEGEKLIQVKKAMETFIYSLPSNANFNFYQFASNYSSLFETSQPNNEMNVERALQFITNLKAHGCTELMPALEVCCKNSLPKGIVRQCFVLTDGRIDKFNECLSFMRIQKSNHRFIGIGLGTDVDKKNMVRIANTTNGEYRMIENNNTAESVLMDLLIKSCVPCVTNISINAITFPSQIPTVYGGKNTTFFMKIDNLNDSPVLEGFNNGTISKKLSIPQSGYNTCDVKNQLLGLSMIRDLENIVPGVYPNFKKEDVDKRMIEVSLKYNVLSEKTALFAVKKNTTSSENTMESEVIYGNKKQSMHSEMLLMDAPLSLSESASVSLNSTSFAPSRDRGSIPKRMMSLDGFKYKPKGLGVQYSTMLRSAQEEIHFYPTIENEISKKPKTEKSWKEITTFIGVDSSIKNLKWLSTLSNFPMDFLELFSQNNELQKQLLSTYFMCLWLNEYFIKEKITWQMIEIKARQFLKKNTSTKEWEKLEQDGNLLFSEFKKRNISDTMDSN